MAAAGAEVSRRAGGEFLLAKVADPAALRVPQVAKFFGWMLPVRHAWPCAPGRMDGFVEKAATGLATRFLPEKPAALLAGSLDGGPAGAPGRRLASNLRGRALQLFGGDACRRDAGTIDPGDRALYVLVGKAGLFAGTATPRETNGFHPGGEKFFPAGTISRAGGKIAGALHHLRLHQPPPPSGARWLELGASPGGMTAELLARGYRVTAVDRAPLDARLRGAPGLTEQRADALHFRVAAGCHFDALLCDMNGDPRDSVRAVLRQLPSLAAGGLVVFTLKLTTEERREEIDALVDEVLALAGGGGLRLIQVTHLPANRREFTCFFTREA